MKRVTTLLRSTISKDPLKALAFLTVGKKFVQPITDFEDKVINIISGLKNVRIVFMYKK